MRWTLTDQDLREVSELERRDTSFRYESPPTVLIAPVYRRTGAPRQQCRCPPYEHMPYCALALLPDAGVSGFPPQPSCMVEVPIR